MERQTRGITTRLILEYVRKAGGEGAVQELIAETGDGLDQDYLSDERGWISFDQKVRMLEAAKRILGDPEAPYRIGQSFVHLDVGSAVKMGLRMLKSPSAVLKAIPDTISKFGDTNTAEVIRANRHEGILRYCTSESVAPQISDCEFRRGLLSAIPMLFGRPPAEVEHTVCAARGDAPYCEFKVSWRPRLRPDWMLTFMGASLGMLVYVISGYPGRPQPDLGLLVQPFIGALTGYMLGHVLEDMKHKQANAETMRKQNALLVKTNEQLINDLETAYHVQRTLLPAQTPKIRGLDVAGRLFYARRIGGDFYDYIPKGDKLGVCIADVCGKGIQAALFTSILKNAMWQGMYTSSRPKKLLAYVDKQVSTQLPEEMFITMTSVVADVSRDKLAISSAGHEPAILYRASTGKAEVVETGGLALGLASLYGLGTDILEERDVDFMEGDVLMLYTDGALEHLGDTDGSREYLCEQLQEFAHLPAENIINSIFSSLITHTPGGKRDDLTLVVIKRVSRESGSISRFGSHVIIREPAIQVHSS